MRKDVFPGVSGLRGSRQTAYMLNVKPTSAIFFFYRQGSNAKHERKFNRPPIKTS